MTEFVDEGILLAPGAVPLPFLSAVMNGFGRQLAERMRGHRRIATGGVLVDDSSSGRIRTLPFGVPYVKYDVTDVDQAKFIKAAYKLAELYFAAGAKEVITAFHSVPVLKSPDELRLINEIQPRVEDTEYFTAHIMGTCRMHSDRRRSLVRMAKLGMYLACTLPTQAFSLVRSGLTLK